MKLCIPVRIPNGLDSCVEPHLPNAEHLLFFDTDTRDIQHVALRRLYNQRKRILHPPRGSPEPQHIL